MNFGMLVHVCTCVCMCVSVWVCVCVCLCVCVCVCVLCPCMYVCITLLSVTLASSRLPILLKTSSIMHMKPRQRQLANREGVVLDRSVAR